MDENGWWRVTPSRQYGLRPSIENHKTKINVNQPNPPNSTHPLSPFPASSQNNPKLFFSCRKKNPKIPRKWMWQRMHSRHAVRAPSAPASPLPLQWSNHSSGRRPVPRLGFGSDIPNPSTNHPTLEETLGVWWVRWVGTWWLGGWWVGGLGLGPLLGGLVRWFGGLGLGLAVDSRWWDEFGF